MASYNADTKTWSGTIKAPIFNLKAPFGLVLLDCLEKNPRKVIQINHDSQTYLTCGEVRRKSIRVANSLSKMGFGKGDIVMVAIKNQPEMAPIFYGCFLIGAPLNPIDVSFSQGKFSPKFFN